MVEFHTAFGFDNLLNEIQKTFDVEDKYPPYNVIKTKVERLTESEVEKPYYDGYIIEIAVAGFTKGQVKVYKKKKLGINPELDYQSLIIFIFYHLLNEHHV